MRHLTESQAWRQVAEAFSGDQQLRSGMCSVVSGLLVAGVITQEIANRMSDDIYYEVPLSGGAAFIHPLAIQPHGCALRCLYACFMAEATR